MTSSQAVFRIVNGQARLIKPYSNLERNINYDKADAGEWLDLVWAKVG
jgi:hypothetical protein